MSDPDLVDEVELADCPWDDGAEEFEAHGESDPVTVPCLGCGTLVVVRNEVPLCAPCGSL